MGVEIECRIMHSLEKIATCAELLTQILCDNRETINLMFKDMKDLSEYDKKMKLYEHLKKQIPIE